jgi:superfamily II DNA/RNA helicase
VRLRPGETALGSGDFDNQTSQSNSQNGPLRELLEHVKRGTGDLSALRLQVEDAAMATDTETRGIADPVQLGIALRSADKGLELAHGPKFPPPGRRWEKLTKQYPLLVFHNADHDLQVLAERLRARPSEAETRIWDTLVASVLLKPWDTTHALRDHRNTAPQDAAATLRSFNEQLGQLEGEISEVLSSWISAPTWHASRVQLFKRLARVTWPVAPAAHTAGEVRHCTNRSQAIHWLWTCAAGTLIRRIESSDTNDVPFAVCPQTARERLGVADHTAGQRFDSLVAAARFLLCRAEADRRSFFNIMLPEVLRRHPPIERALHEARIPPGDTGLRLCFGWDVLHLAETPEEELALVQHLTSSTDRDAALITATYRSACHAGTPSFGNPGSCQVIEVDGALRLEEHRPWLSQSQRCEYGRRLAITPGDTTCTAEACEFVDANGNPIAAPDPWTGHRWSYWRDVATALHSIRLELPQNALLVVTRAEEELDAVRSFLADEHVGLLNADRWRTRLRHMEAIVDGREARPVALLSQTDAAHWSELARTLEADRAGRIRFVFLDLPFEHWCEWSRRGDIPRHALREAAKQWLLPWCQGVMGGSAAGTSLAVPLVLDPRAAELRSELPRRFITWAPRTGEDYRAAERSIAQPMGSTSQVAKPAIRTLKAATAFLRRHWKGKHAFHRPVQENAVRTLMETDDDLIVSLPTGGGKSLIFQVPALALSEATLRLNVVVSPLRALMTDQVENIPETLADRVTMLSGDLPAKTMATRLAAIANGGCHLVYIAPERLRSERFQKALLARATRDGGLGFIVFDEAHCISSWGHDFRPDYLKALNWINDNLRRTPKADSARVLCLSATMTSMVVDNLKQQLVEGLAAEHSRKVTACPKTPGNPLPSHVQLEPREAARVEPGADGREARYEHALHLLHDGGLPDNLVSTTIVFTRRRHDAEAMSTTLSAAAPRWRPNYFHAGLHRQDRLEIYEEFKARNIRALCATCAFGMGMDIPHLHRSVHLQPPSSPESLVQEAGRIGRNAAFRDTAGLPGGKCTAYVLHDPASLSDYTLQRGQMMQSGVTPKLVAQIWSKLVNLNPRPGPSPGSLVAIIPSDVPLPTPDEPPEKDADQSKRRPNPTGLNIALYWLERCGRIRLEATCPQLLEMDHIDRLALADRTLSDDARVVADTIRQMIGSQPRQDPEPPQHADHAAPATPRRSGLAWLLRTALGFFFGESESPTPSSPTPAQSPPALPPAQVAKAEITLNVAELSRRFGERSPHPERVLAAIMALQKRRALRIRRQLQIRTAGTPQNDQWLVRRLKEATAIAKAVMQSRERRTRSDWKDWIESQAKSVHPPPPPFELDRTMSSSPEEQRADKQEHATRTMELNAQRRSLARLLSTLLLDSDAGLLTRPKGKTETPERHQRAGRSPRLISRYGFRWNTELARLEGDTTALINRISFVVGRQSRPSPNRPTVLSDDLSEILERCGNSAVRADRALQLANAAGAWRVERTLIPTCHILTIQRRQPAELTVPADSTSSQPQPSALLGPDAPLVELAEQVRLRSLQLAAVYLLLRQPAPDDRMSFVLRYFACRTVGEVESLIEDALAAELAIDESFELAAVIAARRRARFEAAYVNGVDEEKKPIIEQPQEAQLLVNAGPGSGKTTLLLWRAAYHLYSGSITNPRSIVLLAFNRAIVAEIRQRAYKQLRLLGFGDIGRRIQCMTFDGLVARGLTSAGVTDPLTRETYEEKRKRFVDACQNDPNLLRNLLGEPRLLMIDEAQDMRPPLGRLLLQLKASFPSIGITIVGDDDQDIYAASSYTGPREQLISVGGTTMLSELQTRLAMGARYLLSNYRSSPALVTFSQEYIEGVASNERATRLKAGQQLRSVSSGPNQKGTVSSCDDYAEFVGKARLLLPGLEPTQSVALLVRTNAEVLWWSHWAQQKGNCARLAAPVLRADQFRLAQTRRWHQWRLLLDELDQDERLTDAVFDELFIEYRSALPPETDPDAEVHLNDMRQVLQRELAIVRVRDWQSAMWDYKCGEWDRVRRLSNTDQRRVGDQPLVISTVYQAKGLEYDCVLIPPPLLPHQYEGMVPHRLLYVAATRAKHQLLLSNRLDPPTDKPAELAQLVLKGEADEMNISSFGKTAKARSAINSLAVESYCTLRPTNKCDKLWMQIDDSRLGFTVQLGGLNQDSLHGRVVELLVGQYDSSKLGDAPVEGNYPGWHYYPIIASVPFNSKATR